MTLYTFRPVANGLRTDHPIPDLPFVDDAHIPVTDRVALEAVGRKPGTDMWGREDLCREGGWVGFTTDPKRHDLAWCVRWHPEHGRSVVLYRDRDISGVHMAYWGPALLFRSGGYWWDGATWYRPSQVWDRATEEYARRPVPAAVTVTAADLLDVNAEVTRSRILAVSEIDPDAPSPSTSDRWADDLALWAQRRNGQGPPLECVVKLAAPELTGDQLVGANELAEIGGVAASTLRAYLSRDEADVPRPQATVGGRSLWARPVACEWAEQRRRSHDGVTATVSTEHAGASLSVGVAEVWAWFTRVFLTHLWERPDQRKRWALRWRNEAAVRELARGLGWEVAAGLTKLVPTDDLAITVRHAVLDEFALGQDLHHQTGAQDAVFYGITPAVTRTLDWLIRHDPAQAGHAIGDIIGDAEGRLGIPRDVSEHSLRTALSLDSKLDPATCEEFLNRVLTPHQPVE